MLSLLEDSWVQIGRIISDLDTSMNSCRPYPTCKFPWETRIAEQDVYVCKGGQLTVSAETT